MSCLLLQQSSFTFTSADSPLTPATGSRSFLVPGTCGLVSTPDDAGCIGLADLQGTLPPDTSKNSAAAMHGITGFQNPLTPW